MTSTNRNGTVPRQWAALVRVIQTVLLLVAVGAVFMEIGQQDHQIDLNSGDLKQLGTIASDLVRSQVLGEARDAEHYRILENLDERLRILEANRTR